MCVWGGGPIGSNGACSTLCRISGTPSTTHNQIGPFWCCFPSVWVCVRSRPLWISPMNSPVRLEFLPLLPQSPQVFSVRGLRLYFLKLELWVARSVTWSTSCCLAGQLQLCPPHSTIHHLTESASHCLAASTLRPAAHLCPSYRSGWMFLLYLLCCQTSIQFNCLSVLVVFRFLTVVVLLVVRGGTVCLPTPPSWLEICPSLIFNLILLLLENILFVISSL